MDRLIATPPARVLSAMTVVACVAAVLIRNAFAEAEATMQARGAGIVTYELAFTGQKAYEILDAWGPEGQAAARHSLLVDFAFMPAYALAFAGITLVIARAQKGALQTAGLRLTLAPIIAAVLDVIENVMLLSLLGLKDIPPIPPMIAGIAASLKFALLLAVLLYWPVAGAIWSMRKLRVR